MKNKISLDHINISVRNFNEAALFYKEIFDFEVVELGENKDWGVLKNGEFMICVHESDLNQNSESMRINHFALRVQNIEPVLSKLKQKKIKIRFGGEYTYPHSSSWYIRDPSGHSIEIVRWNNDTIKF